MTLASWFSSMWHSPRLTPTGARRNRSRAFHRRASFEALEDRRLLSATVSFTTAGQTVDQSAGGFNIRVNLSAPPSGTPTVSPFASDLNGPGGLAFDAAGNLYVADSGDGSVQEVSPAGVVSTFASGFNDPVALAFDSNGNLYVADNGDGSVDIVTPTVKISNYASGFDSPSALAFDSAGNLYVASKGDGTVSEVAHAGRFGVSITTYATGFGDPDGLVFDDGDLYVANYEGKSISKVAPGATPVVTTYVNDLEGAGAMAVDAAGNLFVASVDTVIEVTAASTHSAFATGLGVPTGLAFDSAGNLYVANGFANTVVKVSQTVAVPFTLSGTAAEGVDYTGVSASPLTFGIDQTSLNITGTLLSDPGPNQTLTFALGTPIGGAALGSPSADALTITEPAAVRFSIGSETVNASAGTFSIPVTVLGTPIGTSTVSPFALGFDDPVGVAVDAAGNLYVANAGNDTVSKVTPSGAVSTFASGLDAPAGLAFDAAGNLYVSNTGNGTVSEVSPAGTVSLFATGFDDPLGLAFDSAGNLYVANNGAGTVSRVTPGAVASTTFATALNGPDGLAFDAAGNLYVANAGKLFGLTIGLSPPYGTTVSEVAPGGTVSNYATGLDGPAGLALDAAGDLFVTNLGAGTVSEVAPGGTVSTYATGLDGPAGLALDAGSLYVADDSGNMLNQVTETLSVPFTLGGTAAAGVAFSGVTPGVLTFGIGQTTEDITGKLLSDPGPGQTLTFTLGAPTGGVALGSPAVNTLTITEPAGAGTMSGSTAPPVFLGEQRVFSHKGKHKKLIGFELLFSGALDTGGAQATGHYGVTQKLGKKSKVLRVRSALYNPGNFSVAISVAGFNTAKKTQVTIAGLEGADGAAIPEFESRL